MPFLNIAHAQQPAAIPTCSAARRVGGEAQQAATTPSNLQTHRQQPDHEHCRLMCLPAAAAAAEKQLDLLIKNCFGDLQFLLDEFSKLEMAMAMALESNRGESSSTQFGLPLDADGYKTLPGSGSYVQ